jgi:trimethylamine---corrinoid protein Co-methyltransferase
MMSKRPHVEFLDKKLIEQIIDQARTVLCELGVRIYNPAVVSLLSAHDARIGDDGQQVLFTGQLIDQACGRIPKSFRLFDTLGNQTHQFNGNRVYFTPGSSSLEILDVHTKKSRRPQTADYIRYAKLIQQLPAIASQSTAFVPDDIDVRISDSYRLFLSLLFGEKPVVTGTFTSESFSVMKDFQLVIRGDESALRRKPLTIFSCCPTSPLQWSEITSENIRQCAEFGIPLEFIAMPLAGFVAPVTLVGTLIQHTAETLSGIVISQLCSPGTPVLYGGSPAIFDVRYETAPMGAIETMMIDCAYNEIGKYLKVPTQAYIGLSDAKMPDAQAGLETGMGALLAALAGINNISGPGMLDFENCFSLEKLVMDNEICRMIYRLLEGIEPHDDFPALPRFKELLEEKTLLISEHTLTYFKTEHLMPGAVINRKKRSRWETDGSKSVEETAHEQVEKLVTGYQPSRLPAQVKKQLLELMKKEAAKVGQQRLPAEDYVQNQFE